MKLLINIFIASLCWLAMSSLAVADNISNQSLDNENIANSNTACTATTATTNPKNAQNNLADLDAEINNLRRTLGRYTSHHGWRVRKTYELKQQLTSLDTTRQHLIDKMYINGCSELRARASESAKIEQLEKSVAKLEATYPNNTSSGKAKQ